MKRIYNSLLSVIFLPVNLLKRTKIDNFVGGLLFGALFSLAVNVATFQLQELIQRQRVLEAVEFEIAGNLILANDTIKENDGRLERMDAPNYFYSAKSYYTRVWDTSEALKYTVQLDPDIQGHLTAYYNYMHNMNKLLERSNELYRSNDEECYIEKGLLRTTFTDECRKLYFEMLNSEADTAVSIARVSNELLDKFHPTKDRRNSVLLRSILGDKAVNILLSE